MKTITIFTPTYNRAYCLDQIYQSLVGQTSKDFIWLIVDDGSTDETKTLVHSWQAQSDFEIQYLFKENGGMHTAHNVAYENITTTLNVCIDSDDFMPPNAVENILNKWASVKSDAIAGIIGLDAFKSGAIVGTKIPENIAYSTLNDLYQVHQVSGDKKLVIRTAVVREFPLYPVYKDERLVPLSVLYLMIDQKYKWACSNEVYCIVEYLPDGSSNNILKQYRKSPKGFAHARIVRMQHSSDMMDNLKSAAHLVSSAIFAKDIGIIQKSPKLLLTILAMPFGLLLNAYIRIKTTNT